jgi:hypothetical protein
MKEIYPILLDVSAPGNGTGTLGEVDLNYYFASPGSRNLMATLATYDYNTSDTYTLAYKLQESADTVDGDYTDVTNGGFTSVTKATEAIQTAYFAIKATTRYVRAAYTMSTTTGVVVAACELFTVKREV